MNTVNMSDVNLGYIEVIPNQTISPSWKHITVNTGAAQGTLQDIKRPEACGGYAYKYDIFGDVGNRNRFIYWRISHHVLELSEESLDCDLTGNHVSLRFQETPVLDGVGVHEFQCHVIILVATVSSVHRIALPHPSKRQRDGAHLFPGRQTRASIFAGLNATSVREPGSFHILNLSGAPGTLPHSSATWLSQSGEAHFALGSNVGGVLVVRLPPLDAPGPVSVRELRHSSVMQRVWTGIVPSIMMRSGSNAADAAVSLCFHLVDDTVALFALCRDGKIRMWHINERDNIMVSDLLQSVSDGASSNRIQQTGQRHVLRKATVNRGRDLLLAAFLQFVDCKMFVVMKLIHDSGLYQLQHQMSIYPPDHDLTDFCLTPHHLWALWTNNDSEPILRFATIDSSISPCSGWNSVTLETPIGRDCHFPEGLLDPREAYCQHIFSPGRFSLQTIGKALNIFRRSTDSSFVSDVSGSSYGALLEEVVATVEQEIHGRAGDPDLSDDDYVKLQLDCWSRFYLGCIQYHQVGTKPMGLFVDPSTGLSCLIKKNSLSFLRPRDPVEVLMYSPIDENVAVNLSSLPSFADAAVVNDLVSLFGCLLLVRSQLTLKQVHDFKYEMFHLMSPDAVAHSTVDDLLLATGGKADEQPLLKRVENALQSVCDLVSSVEQLFSLFDLSVPLHRDMSTDDIVPDASRRRLLLDQLYNGHLGSSILAQSVQQMAQFRLDVCRDLLIFLVLVHRCGTRDFVNADVRESIRSTLVPKAGVLTLGYFMMTWMGETISSSTTLDIMDVGARQLAILNLSDSSASGSSATLRTASHPYRLVELFVNGSGGVLSRALLEQSRGPDDSVVCHWNKNFMPHVTMISCLLWPMEAEVVFPEFLAVQCQYVQLQEYVRLLQPWCEWNSCSRKFLCGYAHLVQGEPSKALDWFLAAADGVAKENFLVSKVLQATDNDPSQSITLYYLKVIRLFEQFLHANHVTIVAKAAIDSADRDSAYLPTLWTLLFKYLLELGHTNDAYDAMLANPNFDRKKDCLRQFVVLLFERRQLTALVEFPYTDLHDEVVDIIESRARTIDLAVNNYYELLYSFHIYRANFRRAGSVMYEFGSRLCNEIGGVKGLQKQAKCYLTAMNALRQADPNYAWIIKPLSADRSSRPNGMPEAGMSPKRNTDGDEIPYSLPCQVVVIELSDMKKEYELLLARLRLAKMVPDSNVATGPSYSAEETLVLLSHAGLFDMAIRISRLFDLSLKPVFDALTIRCVHLSRSSDKDRTIDESADWLSENEIPRTHPHNDANATDRAWQLLQFYLSTHEKKGQIDYHRCITVRLLSLGGDIPNWLIASYKALDVADLLRQYLKFGMWCDATQLTLDYIDALLGKGPEYFGLRTKLTSTTGSAWLPYTAIDHLLNSLVKNSSKDPDLNLLLDSLQNKLSEYHHRVELSSEAAIATATNVKLGAPFATAVF